MPTDQRKINYKVFFHFQIFLRIFCLENSYFFLFIQSGERRNHSSLWGSFIVFLLFFFIFKITSYFSILDQQSLFFFRTKKYLFSRRFWLLLTKPVITLRLFVMLNIILILSFSLEQASDSLFTGHLKKMDVSLAGQRPLKIHTSSKPTFELLLVIKTIGKSRCWA